MTRISIKVVVVSLAAAALFAAPGGMAATPQEIYRDYADNGRLDGQYTRADLDRALTNAAVQAYGGPSEGGLKPEVETGGGTSNGHGTGGQSTGGQGAAGQGAGSGPPAVTTTGGLPFTGLDLGLIAAGAAGLLLLGFGMRRVARQRQ